MEALRKRRWKMRKVPWHQIAIVVFAAGLACGAAGQEADRSVPRVENAQVERRASAGSLAAEVKQWAEQTDHARWLGYAVAEIDGERTMCCGDYDGSWRNGCGYCRLEDGDRGNNVTSRKDGAAKLEASKNLVVLLRAENKRVMKVRVVSEECTVDAGNLTLTWLSGVKPLESVELLQTFVQGTDLDGGGSQHMAHAALTAIAMHADSAADRALVSFSQRGQPASLRRQAAFWLGEARGKAGLEALERMAKTEPSSEVRAQVTFALSVSHEPGAVEEMIRMAHDDESSHVRGQALFWLAHKAGQKAVGAITGAIENDPDTDVKKKAVFALSQLPKDEGVPKLIEVAQTNHNREVRKQAMFWLGQSNDPRALAFFEKVLTQ
jgi:HEAT repeat protein